MSAADASADPLILAIRPEPGLGATLEAGKAHGLSVTGEALFEIVPRGWEPPDPASIDALLIGSANAIRHGGDALQAFADKPVHAVGKTTAEEARKAGFAMGSIGEGGLQTVLGALQPPLRLLRVTGEDHVSLSPPVGITITTRIAYESRANPLSPAMAERLKKGGLVLLHSAIAAAYFAAQCEANGLSRSTIALACLGPRIADAAGEGWRAIHIPNRPNDAALLAMVRELWL